MHQSTNPPTRNTLGPAHLLTVRIDETLAALAHYTPKETD